MTPLLFLVIASLYEIFYHKTYQCVTKYRLRRSLKCVFNIKPLHHKNLQACHIFQYPEQLFLHSHLTLFVYCIYCENKYQKIVRISFVINIFLLFKLYINLSYHQFFPCLLSRISKHFLTKYIIVHKFDYAHEILIFIYNLV